MRIILMIFFLVLCFVSSNVIAQNKIGNGNAKCDEVIVRDSSHPVWRDLDALYGRIAEAVRKKDLDFLFALYTPDFQVKLPNGEISNRDQTLGFLRNVYVPIKETTHTSNIILRLTVCGEDKATATVLQQWYRTQTIAGKLRRVESNAVQDEHWVKTPDSGWKRAIIDEIRDGAGFIDGKRINPKKPLDPELPAYDPYETRSRQSVADTIYSIIMDNNIDSALRQFNVLKQSEDYYVSEIELNNLGYRLLNLKKLKDAIEIFKLNVKLYPQSANVYDSLGEAYMINGDKELAIKNYQKVIELNPQNKNAVEMLKKLRTQ